MNLNHRLKLVFRGMHENSFFRLFYRGFDQPSARLPAVVSRLHIHVPSLRSTCRHRRLVHTPFFASTSLLHIRSVVTSTRTSRRGGTLEDVQADQASRCISLKWSDENTPDSFPVVYLRDNCLCPACYHQSSGGRLILMRDFDPQVQVKEAKIEDDGELVVSWEDGHTSRYPAEWLALRRFTPEARAQRAKWHNRPPKTWGAELKDAIPSDTLENILNDDNALYNWLTSMEDLGLFIIRETPSAEGQLTKIGKRVAHLRLNSYGALFTVKSKKDASNIAYTSASIGLHGDLPYYDYVPGIQMLHCIAQTKSEGGDNEFSDGFEAARQLKEEFPEYYRILTTVPCYFNDAGVDHYKYHMLNRTHVIKLNDEGEVFQITYNNQCRDTFTSIPMEQVQPFYDALKKFDDILYDKKNVTLIKLKEGEIACFHNFRVLHGRKGYLLEDGGFRHLEGGYIDWDELRSRRRVLQSELGRFD